LVKVRAVGLPVGVPIVVPDGPATTARTRSLVFEVVMVTEMGLVVATAAAEPVGESKVGTVAARMGGDPDSRIKRNRRPRTSRSEKERVQFERTSLRMPIHPW